MTALQRGQRSTLPAMDMRSTIVNVNMSGGMTVEPFLEIDLRDLFAATLLGRRGQLQFSTKIVFKTEDSYRKAESMIQLWADIQVTGQDQVSAPGLGRARVPDPIFFAPLREGCRSKPHVARAGEIPVDQRDAAFAYNMAKLLFSQIYSLILAP
jgi:hypothetical protein